MNDMLELFIEDLKDNVISLNNALMHVQNGNSSREVINSIFRVAHTIKGNSAAMNFTGMEKVMHTMEDFLQDIRSGSRELSGELLKLMFSCHDFLEDCLENLQRNGSDKGIDIQSMLEKLTVAGALPSYEQNNQLLHDRRIQTAAYPVDELEAEIFEVIAENIKRGIMPYKLEVNLDKHCIMKSVRAWMVFEKVEGYASIVCSSPERPTGDLFGNGEFIFDGQTMHFIVLTEKEIGELGNEIKNIVEVSSVVWEELPFEKVKTELMAFQNQTKPVQLLEEANNELLRDMEIEGILQKEQQTPKAKGEAAGSVKQENSFIRVPVNKVDTLINMLGELLIFNAQLEQKTEETIRKDSGMHNVLSRTAKLIKEIQSLSMSLRMIEIKPTLHRLTRIARDTAAELNKNIAVVIEGEDTEIDRSAAERLFDPLMHLVRNSVSHGIETETDRIAAGKKPEGQVTIRAYSKRGNVYIEVSDDGRGLDIAKILQKARTLKIADQQKEYSDEDIIRFIFKPGFSTQEKVNNISGRGVGMNVVEEEVKRMGGKIEMVNVQGNGCTFILRIPMNMAVVNGTVVEILNNRYIIPTLFIKEFFIADKKDWVSMQGQKKAIWLRQHVIPVLFPEQLFDIQYQQSRERNALVILEMEHKLLAFPIDRIVSRQEIVSKPLDDSFNNIGFASGASILGDGLVSLILDIEAMFRFLNTDIRSNSV